MTYGEKFDASEHKAHYQNIATKVLREMTELRASVEKSPNTPRRWVWELLQNAKDVDGGDGVNVVISEVEKDGNAYLVFEHDGLPFSADNIRFLIEQISSKDRIRDAEGRRKQTGKFGTGFLTTHMLSEKVGVRGVIKEEGLDYRKFTITLDRSGYELADIIESVKNSKSQIKDLDFQPPYLAYNSSDLNTRFVYTLKDNLSRRVTEQGINDLEFNLPYALCFVSELSSVAVKSRDIVYSVFSVDDLDVASGLKLVLIEIAKSGQQSQFINLVTLQKGLTSIAIPVDLSEESISIRAISSQTARIFCDFPLIGTEQFPFPSVINNPNFNPTDPRNGIFLTDSERSNPPIEENKRILEDAVALYSKLVDFAISNNWKNLHFLAMLGKLKEPTLSNTSPDWYARAVKIPLRNKLERAEVVLNAAGRLCPILNDQGRPYILFPFGGTKEIREVIWELAEHWFPNQLPSQDDVEYWVGTIWSNCGKMTLANFALNVEKLKTLEHLSTVLKNVNSIEWLNLFYEMLSKDEKEFATIMEARSIVPNQNGDFEKKGRLQKQDGHVEEVFKDILKLFGNDVRSRLLAENVELEFESTNRYSQADAVSAIASAVHDKTNDREMAKNFRSALNLMIRFFNDDPKLAKSLFPSIFSRKHILYDDEEIMDNISKAEELKDLLATFKVSSADELRRKFEDISGGQRSLLPITEEILVSMGITNIDDWNDAMQDMDIRALFDHRSVPSADMFVLSQTYINRARQKVIQHLTTLEDYNLDELDTTTATTVLAGVYKLGRPIRIVFRPAYNGEVIVYYGSEKDTLEYVDSELWVDDGIKVWEVTLGYIIRKNGIKKFSI